MKVQIGTIQTNVILSMHCGLVYPFKRAQDKTLQNVTPVISQVMKRD